MNNYQEYNDIIAFHPGYYIKEIIEDMGITQEDFAKRLGTTPKNISDLVNARQSLSMDIAMKLSRLLNTSIEYWVNLQKKYEIKIAEINSQKELAAEQILFKNNFDYNYYTTHFNFPALPRQKTQQLIEVRNFLGVSSLSVLSKPDMSVSFRSSTINLSESNTIKANTLVQIAINQAINTIAPKFDKKKLLSAVDYALTLTTSQEDFYPLLYDKFLEAGVIFIILPNIKGSNINGATKKIKENVMLLVNDRRLNADCFWFTLFHEIGHIMNGDYGISFDKELGKQEEIANKYAEELLIPPSMYRDYINKNDFSMKSIIAFAKAINRDPGIVLGRLQKDKFVPYNNKSLQVLRRKYKINLCS